MSPTRPIEKVLVANRGEIAVRVMRTCREMRIPTVAVYSEADRGALHVRKADEAVFIGPAPARESYLSIERILDACRRTGADAVHPGYGFLSENAELARALDRAGIALVGPPAAAMDAMGVKTTARRNMAAAGVPVVPGSEEPFAEEAEARAFAERIGFPVMIKAAAGGGGKGMKRCDRAEDFAALWQSARREATAAFGDDRLYLEKFLEKPRHVEIQVFADQHGNCVWLGERECSVQRRQQKVIEETPSAVLDDRLREAMGEVAVRAARAVGYVGAGTVELLVDAHRNFYFLEMNTRLQVEHPVTEMVTGLDLVRMQLEVARGERILAQEQVQRRGHAIEARVYAEDPARGFLPQPGKITYLRVPGGPGIRDDSGVYAGWVVPQWYDPMISKLVAWAPTRPQAIDRLIRALGEYVVHGIGTNLGWLAAALDHPEFRSGDYDTGFCARHAKALVRPPDPSLERVALIAAAVAAFKRERDAAEAHAARAGQGAARSGWARAGRLRALRGGGR
ncbi:acetyl/propionyl/methylcrotonyl-CoA carboxylase subunit alpha [Anaeromyxobacter sp. PSR-1]|uniref:acetyl-CoA carboxylase biotin carboxylase subunit n=1 Tax=unclassified Anaeromyxobacter TaxID=2620896 RepID=UPI0005E69F7C|nr:acetyl-CoA carboxylase biotin carboxylase subunit [Anaeromyxobacter sp. PSR-1]GAO05429.1 methylcrotonoyl-CoA carboxylase subunit alpha, mitochondrial [Anaeromyxobacter sp. PSR-1]